MPAMAYARPQRFNDRIFDDFRANDGRITSGPFTGRSLLLLTTKGREDRCRAHKPAGVLRRRRSARGRRVEGRRTREPSLVPQPSRSSRRHRGARPGDLACPRDGGPRHGAASAVRPARGEDARVRRLREEDHAKIPEVVLERSSPRPRTCSSRRCAEVQVDELML